MSFKSFGKYGIKLSRWVGDNGSTSNTLAVGEHSLYLCYSDTNYHGTEKKGEPWNNQTVKGWKLKHFALKRESAGISYRIILYQPTGAWWHFDIYITFSRAKEKK